MSELFRHSLNLTPTAWFRNPSRICGGGDPATFGKKSECPSLGGYFKMLREILHLMGKSKALSDCLALSPQIPLSFFRGCL